MDRGSKVAVLSGQVVGLALAFAFAWTWDAPAVHAGAGLAFFTGLALIVLGVGLRSYALRVLGRFFSRDVAIQAGQRVVREGPYRWIRHPAYSGSLLSTLGIGLALTNWASLAALMVCSLAGYGYRIYVEECALSAALGEPYRAYARTTKRLVPGII